MTDQNITDVVREKYGNAARQVLSGGEASCCGKTSASGLSGDPITSNLYAISEKAEVPEKAFLASLGCGNPTALAKLEPGEIVLDLGSGGGIDVILSARRVGAVGQGLRPRHDRRDARARPGEPGEGGHRERRVPEGPDRERSAARRDAWT